MDGTANLCDSLYPDVILKEVEDKILSLVGDANFTVIQVVLVQQEQNGSDCGVFAAAFTTSLAYDIPPETVQFDVSKMRTHLYHSLKIGVLVMFPTL